MSIKISKVFTRPDTNIPWHFEVLSGEEYANQFAAVHAANCVSITKELVDNLNIKFTSEWVSNEAYQAYIQDPILKKFWDSRDEYNTIMEIVAHATEITNV